MADSIPAAARLTVKTRERFRCARCGGPSLSGQWHHRRSRSVHDQWTHDPTNGLWLSQKCHSYVHAHPFESKQMGWIVSKYEECPMNVAVRLWFGWVYLQPDGSYANTTEPIEFDGKEDAQVRNIK